jgi:uncharacterized membrane-anchored protein
MTGLPDHKLRRELADEVHARPPEPLVAPMRVSFLALFGDAAMQQASFERVCDLARARGVAPPAEGTSHYAAEMGDFRLKWERHSEFVRYKFIVPGIGDDPFAQPAIATVPADWLASLPGEVIAAAHAALLPEAPLDLPGIAGRWFGGKVLLGSGVSGGAATALTDLRVQEDGFTRFVVYTHATTPWQAGRIVQRLMEIETYRVLALLALPLARETAPFLTDCEAELAGITALLVDAGEADEAALLARITRLEARMEQRRAANQFRFSAAAAYDELVQRRIGELRESRIQGLQTFQEFTARRLAPAMSTCRSVAARQDLLSQRLARAGGLLATRVDVAQERQNQALLASMNRRARLQLRLQSTVEGLSVAAVTYYIVGLVGHAAEGLEAFHIPVAPDMAMGVSIPIVAAAVAFGLHRMRRRIERAGDDGHEP